MNEKVKIDGIEYVIEAIETPESLEAKKMDFTASLLREEGAQWLYLRRPNGTKQYFVKRVANGGGWDYGRLVSLP